MTFKELEVIDPILRALSSKNYHNPTPIQEQAIPIILSGSDVLGCAQTGTGKTAAFAIPILQLLHEESDTSGRIRPIKGLIITPTRELAIQIDENLADYSKHITLTHTVIYGGVKQGKQVEKLKNGIDVLVATPGRLLDLIQQGYISLKNIKYFVLDEADRMLDMGFINDIRKIIKLLPTERQSLFFSATMPENIVQLSRKILRQPKKIEVTPASSTAESVTQYVYYTNRDTKKDLLLHIIQNQTDSPSLIFSRTKHGADKITRFLKKKKIAAAAIHGNKSQNQRQASLKAFKSGRTQVLVATDIASRGIDIDRLEFVINYDVPNIPETYVHRIGRSGRAGQSGIAFSICEPEENAYFKSIQKLIGHQAKVVKDNPYPQTDRPMTEREKKEFNKEKQKRKMEMIARKRAKMRR